MFVPIQCCNLSEGFNRLEAAIKFFCVIRISQNLFGKIPTVIKFLFMLFTMMSRNYFLEKSQNRNKFKSLKIESDLIFQNNSFDFCLDARPHQDRSDLFKVNFSTYRSEAVDASLGLIFRSSSNN